MSTADAFPTAPQEKQKNPESPDFLSQIKRLEDMAMHGLDTPHGTEPFQFRAGIEIEFALLDPKKFRDALDSNEASSREHYNKTLAERSFPPSDEERERLHKNFEADMVQRRAFQHSVIKNPQDIEGSQADTGELLEEFRVYASDFIGRLPANSPDEEAKRAKWLGEIPDFTTREIINFLLYEEFSKPTLADNPSPGDDSLDALDSYTESQGWLEFRFGTGTLQSGYYDNAGMSEIRMSPCLPSEAIRRKEVIDKRLAEIASQFGVLVQSSSDHEHVNLSVHAQDANGVFRSVIGQDQDRREPTLDVTAGIAKGFQDGIWLNQKDMKWDYIFSPHGKRELTFSPNRKTMRIVNGRMELRANFHQADQALNWLVAGAIDGLQNGHSKIVQEGYQTPEITTTHRVHRTTEFDKHTHLEIQRAFENSQFTTGESGEKFELDMGYNMLCGERIATALLGEQPDDLYGSDAFNEAIIASVNLETDGTPVVSADTLKHTYETIIERKRQYIDKFKGSSNWDQLADKVNSNLRMIKLEAVQVVAGKVPYDTDGVAAALERIQDSSLAKLAFGDNVGVFVSWLEHGIPEKADH